MRSVGFWLASIALVASALVSSSARAGDTGVVNVTNGSRIAEGEEFVAVNPRDPSNIILGSNIRQPLIEPDPINIPFGANGAVSRGVWSCQGAGQAPVAPAPIAAHSGGHGGGASGVASSRDGGGRWAGGVHGAASPSAADAALALVPIPSVELPDELMMSTNRNAALPVGLFQRH